LSLEPPFNLKPTQQGKTTGQAVATSPIKASPTQEQSAYWVTYKATNPFGVVTLQSLSALPPYSRKPGPYGPTMSVCAKVMSRGVHNIAFSLSPDGFLVSDLGK